MVKGEQDLARVFECQQHGQHSTESQDLLLNSTSESTNASNKDHQTSNNRTTDAQTMMHILKANIGTGVLAMPNAFKNVGLWPGFVLVPIIGYICIHCMNILMDSHNYLCDRFNYESLDYDQVAALAMACGPKSARRLAKRASLVVTIFLIVTQIGFCCVYVMFVVENIQLALENLFHLNYSSTTYMLMAFPIIGLTSCTSNLKHLARISTTANLLQLLGLALIFYDLLQFHTYGGDHRLKPTRWNTTSVDSDTLMLPDESNVEVVSMASGESIKDGLPLFFATAVYAFEGIGVVLPAIKEMQHPERLSGLNGVLNTSMSMVALLYMAMGFFGYAKYGQFVQSSITLNLPHNTMNDIVRFIFGLAIGLSYSLQFYVPWTIIWPLIDESLFYAYRPRAPRDKLNILNKLSAENHWAIDRSMEESINRHENRATERDSQQELDGNSAASTLATSYTTSTIYGAGKRWANLSFQHYGSLGSGKHGPVVSSSGNKQQRNRLEDLAEQESDEESLPELEWRPPPRSMRGKRKLVRYTVILAAVSLTFVAATLIPRLDLFISLIGALASSCLAIIFPAFIQMFTFWYGDTYTDHEGVAGARRSTRWLWLAAKNSLLVAFGILGLVTGGWVSVAKLSAAYRGLDEPN